MTARGVLGLAAIGVCSAAAIAIAEPVQVHVQGESCASLDAAALDAAVARELSLEPRGAQLAADLAIELVCPDGVHARVRLDPGNAAEPITADLDLGEEPVALRVKLVALAIAELALQIGNEPAPRGPPGRMTPTTDPEDAPAPILRTRLEKIPPASITVRAGLRVIAGDADPMPTISADLDLGLVRVGLVSAVGSDHREEGRPYILALTLARTLACSHGRTSVCLVARGEGGFVGASVQLDDSGLMPRSVYAGYGSLAVGFEVRRRLAGFNWVANIDLGGADGLIVEQQQLERLDGPFGVAALGMAW